MFHIWTQSDIIILMILVHRKEKIYIQLLSIEVSSSVGLKLRTDQPSSLKRNEIYEQTGTGITIKNYPIIPCYFFYSFNSLPYFLICDHIFFLNSKLSFDSANCLVQ
jgi:hypothetical protein